MTPPPDARAAATAKAPKQRLIGLDGMRGLLALSVILVHTMGALAPLVLTATHLDLLGQVIVVFFALSGFLIYWPFASRIISNRPLGSISDYLRNRALRVYPAYIVIFLFANFVLAGSFLSNAMETMVPYTDAGTGVITNPLDLLLHLTLLQNFFPSGLQTGINSSWTLTVELTFYVVLPLLAIAVHRVGATWKRSRYLLAALPALALIALGVVFRGIAWAIQLIGGVSVLDAEWGANWLGVLSRSFLVWSDNFGFGMLAIVAYIAAKNGALVSLGRVSLRAVATLSLIGGLLFAAVCLVLRLPWLSTGVALASGAFFLLLLLPVRTREHPRYAAVLDWAPFHYIGLISLSVYLWHYPVLLTIIRLGWAGPDTPLGAAYNVALVAVFSIAAGSVTYWLIERPAQRWRPRPRFTALDKNPEKSASEV
ncbi:peptidoglycan/LPS O-acetylase OafA/YrhL [Microbacteriaceae bacterium SG_E_30_P1]|uniref:Peptidoglycan/LPS O-acetylase OafA/YrhL n=1 Tax=Antiquaquibacter oligotrophicus TaxID=2880260 RepID=A0ABT6KNW0_9MICO|nr:acyltransferase [Antiquaquibacter oligotrophicus]MDH6181681.1 peptidoglycan/LPS O-acetylase OafA/YrhL [Antiquaquibacter oligotrophicus]UDF12635.1 acyltransferase [Antiquaquibacter oligotrophicus]